MSDTPQKPKRSRRKRRISKAKRLEWQEDAFLRGSRSANGATGMHTEGFRAPVVNRFRKHESKPFQP